jgi:ankyrin repeat protein
MMPRLLQPLPLAVGVAVAWLAVAPAWADPPACDAMEANWQQNHAELAAPQVSAVQFAAADQGCARLASTVLDAGASVEARDRFGNMPLAHAARAGQEQVVHLLLDHGANPNARNVSGATALWLAAEASQAGTAALLLSHGADPNILGRSALSPLMAASFAGNAALAGMLLDHHADPQLRDSTGKPAIVYAAAVGTPDIVQLLLDAGVDPAARYEHDLTALMWAAGYADTGSDTGAQRAVALLLQRGARVDDADDRGRTALMIAAGRGHAAIVRLLLAHGASPKLLDKNGKSAADLATDETLRHLLAPS